MKATVAAAAWVMSCVVAMAMAQDRPSSPDGVTQRAQAQGSREPPPQAYVDCRGKRAGDSVAHSTPEGMVAATCVDSPNGLVARPGRAGVSAQPGAGGRDAARNSAGGQASPDGSSRYSLEQATSDRAQLTTIAFDGLAFLTGDFGYDSFLPPGKVSDYFGFQYLRDIDVREGGHNTNFLTRIAGNMLAILTDAQKAQLLGLAKEQAPDVRRFAEMRLPLIKAFRLNLEGKLPPGSAGLDRQAIANYSADLYALDGKLSYGRARVMASVLRSLTPAQQAAVARLKFGDSATWPDVAEPLDRRSLPHETFVAVMTYASEMYSWHAGSLAADTYFCPERHGMYFGGFGMKTAPAMGKRDYAISTTLTGNAGDGFLAALSEGQRRHVTALVDLQRRNLDEIVRVRRDIATELRRFLEGGKADQARVLALSRRYGELDGSLAYLYATAFAQVGQTLSESQRKALAAMRRTDPTEPRGPFLYSTPVTAPSIGDTDRFFVARR